MRKKRTTPKKVSKNGKPLGRPDSHPFDPVIADRVVAELTEKSLRKICEADDMPSRMIIVGWMLNNDEFSARCARARVEQADYMDDLIIDAAERTNAQNANAQRVKIGAYQWRAARLKPKRYGDKLDLNVAGQEDGVPIRTLAITATDPVEAARMYREMVKADDA